MEADLHFKEKEFLVLRIKVWRVVSSPFLISLEQRGIFLFDFLSLTLKSILSFLGMQHFFLFCCITYYIYPWLCSQHVHVHIRKSLWRYASTFNWNYRRGKQPSHYETIFKRTHEKSVSELGPEKILPEKWLCLSAINARAL